MRPVCCIGARTLLQALVVCLFGIGSVNSVAGEFPAVPAVQAGRVNVQVWLSTADRKMRLSHQSDIRSVAHVSLPINIAIDATTKYQSMVGFGAAVTDASASLIQNKLNAQQRSALLHDLFGLSPGIDLGLIRLTIGASDFSTRHYSLDDVPKGTVDPSLSHFSIAPNLRDVIPVVREAMSINPKLRAIASPWSPPAWMKTSGSLVGGTLRPEFEEAFARYLVKYVDAYRKLGIPIFALTLQNEPGFSPGNYPGMKMDALTRAHVIANYLGPALSSRQQKTLILDWDHNWDAPTQPMSVLSDPAAARYVAGVAWHCYEGSVNAQSLVHNAFPEKQTYLTECSGGDWEPVKSGGLIWLARNVLLAGSRHWARGVLFWNLALDEHHGPHLGGCGTCEGVVTINTRTGKVTRNDEYYALAHLSRFVRPGAFRVKSSPAHGGIDNVAFQNMDDGSIVLFVVNSDVDAHFISMNQSKTSFQYKLPPRSVATFIWHYRQEDR